MDKRRKPLTPHEQLVLRQKMLALIAEHPEWDVPRTLREIRKALYLTHADMARIGRISEPALRNAEAKRSSPSIASVDALLRPLGLKLAVIRIPRDDSGEPEALQAGSGSPRLREGGL